MKRPFDLSIFALITGSMVFMASCSNNELSPGLEYMPDMYRSSAYKAYTKSNLFADSASSRKPVAGTVPRNNPETLPYHETYPYPKTNEGYEAAGANLKNPLAATPEVLKLGETKYKIYCSPCHGEKGDGNGILVQRDKFAGVPSYYNENLKNLSEGKMYHTIYYGKNMMGSHASQLNYEERWAVIRWVGKLRNDGLGISTPAANESSSSTTQTEATAQATANGNQASN